MKRTLCSEEDIGFYGGKFQAMMDGLDDEDYCEDENYSNGSTKKRRLSSEQVRALEKIFAVENKLEPDKKLKLAQELQLHPRQIAVWFQNRRARWKTKQLEHDYAALKANYDALLKDFDALKTGNQSLLLEIKQLKAKLAEDSLNFSSAKDDRDVVKVSSLMLKEGASADSDSSAVLNDENICVLSYDTIVSESHVLNYSNTMGFDSGFCESFGSSGQLNSNEVGGFLVYDDHHHYESQMSMSMLKVEESDEFVSSEEEPCSNFFSDEQTPAILNYWD